jgi:adenosylhomocysteine nucleosidase
VLPPVGRVLVVAALDEEVTHVDRDRFEVLVTGVGKARAAAVLAAHLARTDRIGCVVNVGTAGSVRRDAGGVYEVDFVLQHDFPYDAVAALLPQPPPRGYVLSAAAPPRPADGPAPDAVTLASGDVFVSDPGQAARLASAGVALVDMEGYAYAATCAELAVPLRCVKAVSDFADADAGLDWLSAIDGCARALAAWLDDLA